LPVAGCFEAAPPVGNRIKLIDCGDFYCGHKQVEERFVGHSLDVLLFCPNLTNIETGFSNIESHYWEVDWTIASQEM
jgi:hypothetical protein